jgi:succinate-semialdehyde dehydrogenase/glutarate-semialdehyde dehydrogenase
MALQAINPANGETLATYDEMTPQQVGDIVDTVHKTFLAWRGTTFRERAERMRRAAQVLRAEAPDYARLMAQEMGKPLRDGVAEAQKCALACDCFADNAERFLAREPVPTEARKSFVTSQPLGVVLAIMPWNFPFWQVFRFAAPGLMAGNAAVLKHASNVPGCALAIEQVFRKAGFPEHLFRTLMIGSRRVDSVIEHPRVRAATLTGSTPAGRVQARPRRAAAPAAGARRCGAASAAVRVCRREGAWLDLLEIVAPSPRRRHDARQHSRHALSARRPGAIGSA